VLRPAPLSQAAASLIVRAAFSPRADAELCRACQDATGGNPLLLRMLSQALRAEGVDPTVPGGGRVADLAPQVVAAAVLPRLRRLPAEVETFAHTVAVLGDRVELRHAAALAELETGPATRAADALTAAGILACGRPIEFVHPTVRHAVYESLPAGQRHRAHRQAAVILDREGAPADETAAHLLVAERMGDDWVVEILRAAAREALARGAVDEAVRYLRRALEEPPHPTVRVEVLFELGSVEARVSVQQSCDHLRRAMELAVDVSARAEIALELARVMVGIVRDTRGALAVLDRAVTEVGDTDAALRVRLEAEFVNVARRYPVTREQATRRLRLLSDHAQPSSLAGCVLLANLAADALESEGAAQEATWLADAALGEDQLLLAEEHDVALLATSVLMSTDQFGHCVAHVERRGGAGSAPGVDHWFRGRGDRAGLPRLPLRAAHGGRSRRQAGRRRAPRVPARRAAPLQPGVPGRSAGRAGRGPSGSRPARAVHRLREPEPAVGQPRQAAMRAGPVRGGGGGLPGLRQAADRSRHPPPRHGPLAVQRRLGITAPRPTPRCPAARRPGA
jgi:hypothetical protein